MTAAEANTLANDILDRIRAARSAAELDAIAGSIKADVTEIERTDGAAIRATHMRAAYRQQRDILGAV